MWRCCVALWTRIAFVLVLTGCAEDPAAKHTPGGDDTAGVDVCETSIVDYENFGQGFMMNWCTPCHSGVLAAPATDSADPRAGAPEGVDFDTHEDAVLWSDRVQARATGSAPTMPPGGGPDPEDLLLLEEWLMCGTP